MPFDLGSIGLKPLMYVQPSKKSVTHVSGTFVTLDTGLNTLLKGGKKMVQNS